MENKISEAMCRLDPALVQEASEPVGRKRNRLRPLLIAACLAALCTVSVAAAAVGIWGDDQWTLFFKNSKTMGELFEVKATYGGTQLPAANTETLKNEAEAGREVVDADGTRHVFYHTIRTFYSIDELEAYLDVDLLETPRKPVSECFFRAFYAEEQDALYVDVYYRPETVVAKEIGFIPYIQIEAYLCTAEGATMALTSELGEGVQVVEYNIKNLDVTAYVIENYNDQGRSKGYFNVNGVAYEVSALGNAAEIQQILETFQ